MEEKRQPSENFDVPMTPVNKSFVNVIINDFRHFNSVKVDNFK